MARVSGAIVAVVMAVLLALTIEALMQSDNVVQPTGGVTAGGPRDAVPVGKTADEILRARARLQQWRAVAGPSPQHEITPAITGSPIPEGREFTPPRKLVKIWEQRQAADWQLLRKPRFEKGKTSLPPKFASVLIQPEGREWRRRRNEPVTYGGGVVIFGTALLLALFLTFRGRIRLVEGPSGDSMERFSAVERANHWVTATSFVVMALTGLIILYGQYLIRPWLGATPYSTLASASAYVHIAFAIPFVAGVAIMIILWLRENLFHKVDFAWLRHGGGFFAKRRQETPPAERFNAGQKIIYWAVVLGAILLLGTGIALAFPLLWLNIAGMQWAQLIHAATGLIMIAVILGHIYIGTIGMEGAFSAMWSGWIDRNWAKEHHRIWYDKVSGRREDASTRTAG